MVDRSDIKGNVIVIADRGYECYNNFVHIQEKGEYVIRVKDKESKGMVSSFANMPSCEVFDKQVSLKLTRKQTNKVKADPTYKFLPTNVKFDFFDLKSPDIYLISFRVVRFKISNDSYETVITNLDEEEFGIDMIKELYHMRWGIETSFRELKYAIGLVNFHSKKVEYIEQEVFARLTMYNFCEIITST